MLKRFVIALVLFSAATVAIAADLDLKALSGNYKITGLQKGGQDAPKEVLDGVKGVTIVGDEFTVDTGGEKKIAKIKLDGSKKPVTIDLIPEDGPQKGKAMPGILTLEKGVLKIGMSEGGERPTEFKKAEMVITLEKISK